MTTATTQTESVDYVADDAQTDVQSQANESQALADESPAKVLSKCLGYLKPIGHIMAKAIHSLNVENNGETGRTSRQLAEAIEAASTLLTVVSSGNAQRIIRAVAAARKDDADGVDYLAARMAECAQATDAVNRVYHELASADRSTRMGTNVRLNGSDVNAWILADAITTGGSRVKARYGAEAKSAAEAAFG